MWRLAVCLAIVTQFAAADVKYGVDNNLAHRLRRSPQYSDCGYYPPPPPPPPFWPPPPGPRRFWHPPPPPPPPPQYQVYSVSDAKSQANTSTNTLPNNSGSAVPCTNCGDSGQSSAVSNAQSDSGQAIAVAVARASTH